MSTDPRSYRVSDADREAAAARLRTACVEGRIDDDELERRLSDVFRAVTAADLDRQVLDLLPPPPPPPPPAPAPAPPAIYYPYAHVQPVASTNGLAIASLIAGFFWMFWLGSIAAVVMGHIALGQIDKSQGRENGKGLAIAGLVLGYGALVLLALTVLAVVSG
jgi:Domain of unknown function (DUF4190)/Domain of unknown function (DUF1707)